MQIPSLNLVGGQGGNNTNALLQLLPLYNKNTTPEQRKEIIKLLEGVQSAYNKTNEAANNAAVQKAITSLISYAKGINPDLGTTTETAINGILNNRTLFETGLNSLITGLKVNEAAQNPLGTITDLFSPKK